MANDGKYLTIESGRTKQEQGINTSAGAADASKIIRLNAAGQIDPTMIPGADSPVTVTASEAISAGDWVNLHNSSGLKARKADATTSGKEAHGYAPSAISNGASGEIRFDGRNSSASGRTVAARQYLSTTPGLPTETAPSSSGNVVQLLGVALSATEIDVNIMDGIILV